MVQGRGRRGFASMDADRQRDIARLGGRSVPGEKRSFAQNHELAATAGRTGGQNVPDAKRSFAQNRALAAEAGRKGGIRRRQVRHDNDNDTRRQGVASLSDLPRRITGADGGADS